MPDETIKKLRQDQIEINDDAQRVHDKTTAESRDITKNERKKVDELLDQLGAITIRGY